MVTAVSCLISGNKARDEVCRVILLLNVGQGHCGCHHGRLAGTSVSHMYDSDKGFLYQLTRLLLNESPTALHQLGSCTRHVLL